MKIALLFICLSLNALAESTSSDKFAQVRGFKIEISGSSREMDSIQDKQLRMIKIDDSDFYSLNFKSLSIPNAKIILKKGNSTIDGEEVVFRMPSESALGHKIVNVLKFKQEEGGLVVSGYQVVEKDRLILLPHNNSNLEASYQEIKSRREAGSGMATGRRSAGLVCQDGDCFIHKEIFDLRTIVRRFIMKNNQGNLEFIRSARIPGEYPQSLISASNSLENLSSVQIAIGEDILWSFFLVGDNKSSLKSNPYYQGSGMQGENPLFEAKSNLFMQVSFGEFGVIDEGFRCESDGKKKVKDSSGNYICGKTDHF